MSASVWSFKLGGTSRGLPPQTSSLASLGVENPRLVFRNMDDDDLTFEIKQDVTLQAYLGYGETVQLIKTVNGVATVWFSGTVSKISYVGNAKTETVRYVVSGPWYQLKRAIWQVACQCYQQLGQNCSLISEKISKVVLFQDPNAGTSITTGQQILNIVTYAASIGIPMGVGTTPAFINVPFEECRDLLLSDAIRRCMQWTPDGVTWFNYASGVGVINAQQRTFLSAVTLDLSSTGMKVEAFDLNPRYDLIPSGVRFNYVGQTQCNVPVFTGCVDPSTGILNTGLTKLSQGQVQVQTVTQDQAGNPDSPQALIGTIDLTQLTATTTEAAPTGLASSYYLSLQTPFWEGEVVTHEQECSGTLRVGKTLSLTGGLAAWASMASPIQQVTEELFSGRTIAVLGTPQHLAPQNFAYMANLTARRALVISGLAAVNFPGASGNNCAQGIAAETQKLINKVGGSSQVIGSTVSGTNGGNLNLPVCSIGVCQNGQLSQLKVYCPQST